MHQKFLVVGRVCCALGFLSGAVVAVAALLGWDLSGIIPAPIAYFMLFTAMAAVLCLLIGFALDLMSHLMRHDMSSVMWLFFFTVVISVIMIGYSLINKQEVDYTMLFYTAFILAAGLRGLWYIVGIRGYEIEKYKNSRRY